MNNVTVLFPGGFKPITGAHMALAQRYAQNPNVDRVIMLIGPKERDGITRDKSIKMFNLLNRNNNIEIQSTDFNSPIMAAYEYLFNLPEDTQGRFALAASEKDDDYVRVKTFIPNIDKYKTIGDRSGRKIPAGVDAIELTVSADPLKYDDGNAISASAVRAALNADAYSKFKASYPNYDEAIVKNIWQMLGGAETYGDVMGTDTQEVSADEFKEFEEQYNSYGRILRKFYESGINHPKLKKAHEALHMYLNDGQPDFNIDVGAQGELEPSLKKILVRNTSNDQKNLEQKLNNELGSIRGTFAEEDIKADDAEFYDVKPGKYMKFYIEDVNNSTILKVKRIAKANGLKFAKDLEDMLLFTESLNLKEWLLQELTNDANELFEGGYMTPKGSDAHSKKIKKLRTFLDKKNDRGFTYDFDKYPKTVFGTKYLNEGGLAGHMNHPYDRHDLSFADMKEMIARALEGRLDIESAVTEKTDGQNIFMTVKDGQVKFARGVKERINPLTVKELQTKFAGRGALSDSFGEAGNDLAAAFSKVGQDKLNSIFQNGKIFANMEIIYPATKNVIAYEKAVLQFHNLVEYDENGNVVETDMSGGNVVQKAIQDANAHMQNTFNLIPPQKIKLGPVENFQDYQDALFKELDQLKNRYKLKDTDKVTEYHIAWWREVIKSKALKDNYNIPEDVLELLVNRWAFYNKSTSITKIKKMIDNEKFLEWVISFDKKDFKKYQKQNMEPFESIFLKLGAEVPKNASNFLAANPAKSVQDIRKNLAAVLRDVKSSNNIATLDKLKLELNRIKRLGGFEKIVPLEGIVFTYGGETYKLTGAFAPINQILGTLKYSR